MTNAADQLDKLSPEMRALLLAKLKKARAKSSEIPRLERGAEPFEAPMAPAQQRLWFLDAYMGPSSVYNLAGRIDLRGPLVVPALEAALDQLIARHEVLRTRFPQWREVQLVDPHRPFALALERLDLLADPQAALAERLAAEAGHAFRLADEHPFRARLFALAPDWHVLAFNLHHIVGDGRSTAILLDELERGYRAALVGGPALPPLPLQYADYAAWQRDRNAGQEGARRLEWWREYLADSPTLELQFDRPRPANQTFSGAIARFEFTPAEANAVRALAATAQTTPFQILLAVFQLLLTRYSGQDELVVGVPFANREHPDLAGLIGFFVNTLPVRATLPPGDGFATYLAGLRDRFAQLQGHQDVAFETLVDQLGVVRDPSHPPLFQVTFNFVVAALPTPSDQPRFDYAELFTATTKFDFSLALAQLGERLVGEWAYNPDLFDSATIARMIGHFRNLLASAAAAPQLPLARLELLDADERRTLVSGDFARLAPQGAIEPPEQLSIHGAFERQAALRPAAIALVSGETQVSYGELERRANQLARALRRRGVSAEVRVGICLERDVALLVAILAVLKAGGVYVPLDPNYPAERLDFIADDGELRLILAEPATAGRLPAAVTLDIHQLGADEAESALHLPVQPEQGAYVIYTSGSTGKPKGVLIPHANVVRLFSATFGRFAFDHNDVWSLFHSYAFDFTVWEIWGAFFYGGRLVVVPYLVSRAPAAFHQLLVRERVTVLSQSPSAFRQLVHQDQQAEQRLDALRYVVFGAEALDLASLLPFTAKYGEQVAMINMYGITETTVHVTWRPIPLGERGARSPIGKAIADLCIYLVDRHDQPVPVGVAGELLVGGAGLARGYFRRPALTAQRFSADPFSATLGGRVYRSGDKACYLPDGQLIYLGRIDQQLKIRGFRIEPGEIQAALADQPGVRENAVLALADSESGHVLVAYIVPEPGVHLEIAALRAALEAVLPVYMVPAYFCTLEAFPLTAHGKLDRRALPGLDALRAQVASGLGAPPETPTEEALAQVWSDGLGGVSVGRDDNFFNLGGDSIRAIRVLGKARERGLEFDLQTLFRFPTVQALAREIERARTLVSEEPDGAPFSLIGPDIRALLPADVEDAYPMAHLQLGMIYEMKTQTEMISYHDVASFVFQGQISRAALEQALALVCSRHPIFRTSLHLVGYGEPMQLVHRQSQVRLDWFDLSALAEGEREAQVQAYLASERERGFDLTVPALVRYAVHALGGGWYRFTQTLCHPILDGWSTSSSIAELFDTHARIIAGQDPSLPAPRLTYRDFIRLERYALEAPEVQGFWRDHLAGYTPVRIPRWLRRPQDPPRDQALVEVTWKLVPERVERLRSLAQRLQVPLKSVFLAAYFKVLATVTGERDIAAGLQVNGRNEAEGGDKVMGLFLNAVPARLDVAPGTWQALIQRAFALEWAIMPYRRYPTAAIQRTYDQPVFETFFNYVSFHAIEHIFRSAQFNTPAGGEYFEPTHFPYFHGFNLDPVQGHLLLVLQSVAGELPLYQLEATRDLYDAVFAAMEASLERPESCHHRADLLPEALRALVLRRWNDTDRGEFLAPSLLALIEARIEAAGDAEALRFQGLALSFRELDARAERLANQLAARGVGQDDLVGVCVERSFHMIIGLLAVLKAGAVYVPLDPTNPAERLEFMIADAQVAAMLTTAALADRPFLADQRPLALDAPLPAAPKRRPVALTAHSGAYMIYTSGSTGRPKGALNSHGAIANRLLWKADYLAITPADRILHKTPFTFDVSVWELFLPLMTGAAMIIAEPEQHRDVAYLAGLMAREQVTVAHFVPSMLAPFLRQRGLHLLGALRHLVCSGEALPAALVGECAAALPGTRLHNLYGPTEAAIDVSAHDTAEAAWPGLVPIGAPIANVQLYVLDRELLPVAPGSPGELFLGGVALARGYHRRPGLTATRFVPDPFSRQPGARLYRSGDKTRWLPDGQVDYLGRLDNQVKLRGFRIELGEIVAVLERHSEVRQAAVLVRADREGNAALVAYLTHRGSEPDEAELRAFLGRDLPEYMVPQRFCALDRFPMTLHGKLDVAALPDLDDLREAARADFEEPVSETEQRLARIWCASLGLDRVGRQDHFFRLGGDSIISLRVVALAEREGLALSIAQLHQHSVLAELAAVLDASAVTVIENAPLRDFALVSESLRASLPEDVVDAYPMSMTQLGMIYHMELEPELKPYFNVDCCLFEGHLEREPFERAVEILVRRHAVLRTSLHLSDYPEPLQLVHREAQMDSHWEDLTGLDEAAQQRRIRAFFEEQVAQPFDISRAPLLRYGVQVLGANRFQLTLVEHHALVDGWSFNSLLAEFFDLVFRLMEGAPIEEPAPTRIAYRDFIKLEREAIASPVARGFWREYLAGAPRLRLPQWPMPPERGVPQLRELVKAFSAEHVGRLQELTREVGSSLKSALLAAHVKVLGFLGNSDDVLTSIITTGRPEAEGGDRIFGLFFNTMPFRVGLGQGSWRELVRRVFETEQRTLPHRRVPLATIQDEHGHEPLFETMFNYINFHVLGKVMVPGKLAFIRKDHSKDPTHFPLRMDFNLDPVSNELYLILQTTRAEIGPERLEQIGAYYERVLHAIAAMPDALHQTFNPLSALEYSRLAAPIAQSDELLALVRARGLEYGEGMRVVARDRHLMILPEAVAGQLWLCGELPATQMGARQTAAQLRPDPTSTEPGARMLALEAQGYRREDGHLVIVARAEAPDQAPLTGVDAAVLRAACHGPAQDLPATTCVGLFEERVDVAPAATALIFGSESWTYQALDQAANRLAHQLLALGAGLEVRIGVCLAREPQLLVALLAVQKTGATYVPMDPDYPDERLEHMLRDAGCRLLIGAAALRERPFAAKTTLVCPSADGAAIAARPATRPARPLATEAAMYLIYTSGSTGKPKGVAVGGAAVVNFLLAMGREPGMAPGDRLLAVTTVSFDIAVLELFLPLSCGAAVVLATREQALDAEALGELLRKQRITHMQATPATWQMLRQVDWSELVVLCGGEALPNDLATHLRGRARAVWNVYGPTETTIWSACRLVGAEDGPGGVAAIGGVLANTSFHALDPNFQAVAPGCEGELHIGGLGLARGYVGQPARSASVFLPDPWSTVPGARLYRTGDLVAQLADGSFAFRGRADYQVKLHGHRIELGEIEAVLRRHAGIAEAVVVLHAPSPERRMLVAYTTGTPVAPALLRAHAAAALPAYMVPAAFAHLDELPRTPNRKLDRKALQVLVPPAPENRRGDAPRTAIQRELAAIWREVLGREDVFLRDDFFALGGQSLLATRAVFLMRTRLGLDANIRLLFDYPELELLAGHLESLRAAEARPALVAAPRPPEVPASYAQRRLYFAQQLNAKSTAFNMPFALAIPGQIDDHALDKAFRTIVARHEPLRTSFTMRGELLVQRVADQLGFGLARVDLRGLPADELERRLGRLGEANAKTPFNLESAPLLRAQLVRSADDQHVLLCCMHHIVVDGWSIGVFFRELEALYLAFRDGRADPLPPLAAHYTDYTRWQRELLDETRVAAEVQWWREQLRGAPLVQKLPGHAVPRQAQSPAGASYRFELGPELSAAIANACAQQRVSEFMLLLAGFIALLHTATGEDDMVLGTDLANRTDPATEAMIGFFVNQLVLRTDLSGDPSFKRVLERVRQTALAAYAHQDLPFDVLVDELNPPRGPAQAPFFQRKFVLNNLAAGRSELSGITTLPLHQVSESKVDLQLNMEREGDQLIGYFNYKTELFEEAYVQRLGLHLQTLLAHAVAHPEATLAELASHLTRFEEARRERQRPARSENPFAKQAKPRGSRLTALEP